MNLQSGETIFVTGTCMKDTTYLVLAVIGIVVGAVLSCSLADATDGVSYLFAIIIIFGLGALRCYILIPKTTIAVSNLRVMGWHWDKGNVNLSIGCILAVTLKPDGALVIAYINDSGISKSVNFPKMENTEQIYNAIYSLISAPPAPQYRR